MTSTINASTSAGLVQTADTSGVLALQTAGTTAVTVDASQNVGIGTASPSYKLDVVRSGNGVSARFSQGSFFSYIYSGGSASYFSADTGALTSYGLTASTLQMSAGNGADQLVVSQTSVKPNVLLDISGASAGRIQFPATQVASANANTLDDYEEGTWTPTIQNFTVSGTSTLTGTYTKIGRVVYFNLSFANTGTIAFGTSALITLPFTGVDYSGMVAMSLLSNSESMTSGSSGVQVVIDAANSRFFVGNFTTTPSGQTLIFAGFYRT
jgi:hypothetical protein